MTRAVAHSLSVKNMFSLSLPSFSLSLHLLLPTAPPLSSL
ncbi:hypothetical protein AMTRI_Chr03g49010 [Amborella trichopoda]